MPRVIVTEGAVRGLERCRQFLAKKTRPAAKRAGQVIARHFALLEKQPEMGHPIPELPELRELVIPFGNQGYVALYRFEKSSDAVYLLAFRHKREAGYSPG